LQHTCISEEAKEDDLDCDVFYTSHESPWQLNRTDPKSTKSRWTWRLVTPACATHLLKLHKTIVNQLITKHAPAQDYKGYNQPSIVDGVNVVSNASTLHGRGVNSHIQGTLQAQSFPEDVCVGKLEFSKSFLWMNWF
jgi:hypothetical protein